MEQHTHVEKHFLASDTVRDIIIGMSDGLTVPFALAAGLAGAIDHSSLIVIAGLAEMTAGSISMGLGGYLAATSDAEHYDNELKREYMEIQTVPEHERQEIRDIFYEYGLSDAEIAPVIRGFEANHDHWVDFMMRFELGLDKPDKKRAPKSAATIAVSYLIGGIIPLSPYFFDSHPHSALFLSAVVTGIALIIFGYIKSRLVGASPFAGALKTVLIGGIAAAAAYTIARLVG